MSPRLNEIRSSIKHDWIIPMGLLYKNSKYMDKFLEFLNLFLNKLIMIRIIHARIIFSVTFIKIVIIYRIFLFSWSLFK